MKYVFVACERCFCQSFYVLSPSQEILFFSGSMRLVNEAMSDEVHRHGGTKMGVIGTGGRTYSTYSRGSNSKCSPLFLQIIGALIVIASLVFIWGKETQLETLMTCASRLTEEGVAVSPWLVHDPQNDGRIVFAAAPFPVVASPPPLDDFFGIHMPKGSVIARRVTEYCQWSEQQHTRRVHVATDCEGGSKTGDECNIYRDDTSYTYVKAWRSHQINSGFFDNPIAYDNPHRDPCLSQQFVAVNGVLLENKEGALIVSALDASPSLSPTWATVQLHATTAADIGHTALSHGFHESDTQYIYSRGPSDGWNNPVVKAAAAYFIDGVVGIELGCHAGDIRVHFETRSIDPRGVAIAGLQRKDGTLVHFPCKADDEESKSGKLLLGYPDGSLTMAAFVQVVLGDASWWGWVYRVAAAFGVVCGVAIWHATPSSKQEGSTGGEKSN